MKYTNCICLVVFIGLLASCAPVNRCTKIKKTPRQYSLNYCCSDMKARKTDLNKESWIVFSDRDDNDTYHNPGGKVKLKKMEFMEPFFVIKEKGEYVRLVKYDPDIVNDARFSRKIKDRKKAEYYGWVHSSRLLLTRQSGTDISSGMKSKAISIISDTTAVVEPHTFFESDSIWTYKDDMLTVKNKKIPFYELFYILKNSPDREKLLISKKTAVSPEEPEEDVLGWVSRSVVKEIGERLFVDIEPVMENNPEIMRFMDRDRRDTLDVASSDYHTIKDYSFRNPALRYSPALSYQEGNAGYMRFNTVLPAPVVDSRKNYVLNVNGNKIGYDDFMQLEKELKNINVMFVFEGKERVLYSFSEIMNVIQNLQTLFSQPEDDFQYKFGAVISYNGEYNSLNRTITQSMDLNNSYDEVLDFLMQEKENVGNYRPLPTADSWRGLQKAVDIIEPYAKETNLLILIGEEGYSEWADTVMVRRMADANCRILGYQVHSEITNTANNFVLQVESMIEHCGRRENIFKRERIVYANQIKPENRFRESTRNVYALNYPENSMTQGWILFPDKSTEVPLLDILASSIDTFVMEVKTDNDLIISSLYKAFDAVGNSRFQYDPLWTNYNNQSDGWTLKKELPLKFSERMPAWSMSSMPVAMSMTDSLDFYLLLSESEIKDIMSFLEKLCKYEPDYKYMGQAKKKARKVCNCPDDDLYFEEAHSGIIQTNAQNIPQYQNTARIRQHIYRLYLEELKSINRLCKISTGTFKSYPLAKAHQMVVGNPSDNEMLRGYTVRNIKSKSYIPDHELDELILYIKNRKEKLDEHVRATRRDVFESNGETYYWVHRDLLP